MSSSYFSVSCEWSEGHYDPNRDRNKWYQSRPILGRASAAMECNSNKESDPKGELLAILQEMQKDVQNMFQERRQMYTEVMEITKQMLQEIKLLKEEFCEENKENVKPPSEKDVELPLPEDDVASDWLMEGVQEANDDEENEFQMVYSKQNKKLLGGSERNVDGVVRSVPKVKVVAEGKPKIPFHIPTLRRPQHVVNNSNQLFEHVRLQKSEDGARFLHPLEKLSFLDFVITSDIIAEPLKPAAYERTAQKMFDEMPKPKENNKTKSVRYYQNNAMQVFCIGTAGTKLEEVQFLTRFIRSNLLNIIRERPPPKPPPCFTVTN